MTPTNELRFVERTIELGPFYLTRDEQGNLVNASRTYRVLQQKWAGTDTYSGGRKEEWRDVPLVKEELK